MERRGALRRGRDAARAAHALRRREARPAPDGGALRGADRREPRLGADLLRLRPARASGAAGLVGRLGARARRAGGRPAPGRRCATSCHSEDLGDAFAALLDSDVEGAVNIASGEPRPIRDLVVALGDAAGRPDLLRIGARPANPAEPASLTAAVDRLRDEVGWTPAALARAAGGRHRRVVAAGVTEQARGDLLDTPAAGPQAARGGAMRAGGYAAATLLAVLSAPLMIRHLGVVDFGRYVTIMSLVAIVAGFTEAGINTIALREYAARTGDDRRAVMRDLLGIRLALTLAGVVAGVAVRARRRLRLGPRRWARWRPGSRCCSSRCSCCSAPACRASCGSAGSPSPSCCGRRCSSRPS